MVTAQDFIEKVNIPLKEGWGYVYGQWGAVWTEAKQKAATREQTVKWGSRWIGKRVTDCSGLVRWALYQLGESIVHHARYQYTDWCVSKGRLVNGIREDGQPLLPGSLVFLKGTQEHIHHVGVYVGDDVCVEAKGTLYGVVTSKPDHWDYWGECKLIDYENKEPVPVQPEQDIIKATVTNPNTWLNVRSGPGKSYPKVFQVERGTVVDVLAESDDHKWLQIKYGSRVGWATADYLTIVEDESTDEPMKDGQDADITDTGSTDTRQSVMDELYTIRNMIDEVITRMGGGIP